jgi:hypothetical protein
MLPHRHTSTAGSVHLLVPIESYTSTAVKSYIILKQITD